MEVKRFSLVKPTSQTPFHIDFNWWQQNESDWRIYLLSCLCPEHQLAYSNLRVDESIDWIDPETAEVQHVDALQHTLITHCAQREDFLTDYTALVDAVFRTLLANGNSPMSPLELEKQLGRPADIILRTLAGPRVYKGLRPVQN
jgi:hypothetical protein